jgi:hypothetical protein
MSKESPNRISSLSATAGLHLLKDQITNIESTLRHLHGALGSHINALDRVLVKGENIKPVKRRSHLLKAATSPLSIGGIFSDFIRSLAKINGARGQSASTPGLSSGGGSYGMSQGQVWAQIANAISSASKRYL